MTIRALALLFALSFLAAPALAGGKGKPGKPARLFAGDDDVADPADLMRKVDREVAQARAGKPRRLIVTAVNTTEWGCECPPFVYAPFAASAPEEGSPYLYPLAVSGVDPARFSIGSSGGTFELTGRFDRRSMTFAEWTSTRKSDARAPRHGTEAFQARQPVFAVESWCFRPAAGGDDVYGEELARMKEAGVRLCK